MLGFFFKYVLIEVSVTFAYLFIENLPKLLSISFLNNKAEIKEDNVHQQINENKKDFLDTNKYNESGANEMKIFFINRK